VYLGWRLLGNDSPDVAFNLYRSSGGGPAVMLNAAPLTQTTDYVDTTANLAVDNDYFIRPVLGGVELEPSESFALAAGAPVRQYLPVPLQIPPGGSVPDYQNPGQFLPYTYNANDASVGDLDGDGDYEVVLKWDPSNSQDVSIAGYTGPTIFDAYDPDSGLLLWRINLGINIRSGAHYTPFIVYDLDGDGKAEVAMKTGPGAVDGTGADIILPGDDPDADFRNADGRITTGPEYLTIFNGLTGAAMVTVPYGPARNDVTTWGDDWGNRSERHLAGVAYLDGNRPSLIFTRGYNGPASGFTMARTDVVAYNWRDGQLTELWHFKARLGQEGNINSEYIAQGNHNLSIADVDGDGFDEIIYGAAAIDHDGTGLYSTGLGHGDALHVSDMDPSNPGLEVFQPHESPGAYGSAGGEFRDAMTGQLIFGIPATNDVGRGVAADIDPNHPGYEMWATTNPAGASRLVYSSAGQGLYRTDAGTTGTSSDDIPFNFLVWWDADPLRELLDGTTISQWAYDLPTPRRETLLSLTGTSSNNSTKSTPSLSADLFGDWREEVMMRSSDNSELRIYTTTAPATSRLFTLMHDSQYRVAIAWQNAGYNQPPHPSFFLGAGMTAPPQPKLFFGGELTGDYNVDGSVDAADYVLWRKLAGTTNLIADGDHNEVVGLGDYVEWQKHFGEVASQGVGSAAMAATLEPTPLAANVAEFARIQPVTHMLSRQLQGRDRDFKVDSTPWERQFVHAAKSTAKNPATASAKLLLIAKTTRVQHADVRAAAHSATDSNAQSPLTRDLFEDLDEAFAALADWPAGTLGTTY
jgi:rhamnogalacturonan endolyase